MLSAGPRPERYRRDRRKPAYCASACNACQCMSSAIASSVAKPARIRASKYTADTRELPQLFTELVRRGYRVTFEQRHGVAFPPKPLAPPVELPNEPPPSVRLLRRAPKRLRMIERSCRGLSASLSATALRKH